VKSRFGKILFFRQNPACFGEILYFGEILCFGKISDRNFLFRGNPNRSADKEGPTTHVKAEGDTLLICSAIKKRQNFVFLVAFCYLQKKERRAANVTEPMG
jgi:hypothetical protein